MAVGAFVKKENKPTIEEILAAIGSNRLFWERLTQFITENYGIQGDFAFYGKNYGWAVRYRKGGKALISIYPGNDSFTVQIVLGEAEARKGARLNLGAKARKVLEEAHRFPEGRWLLIKVDSEKDLDDIKQLILIKAPRKTSK
nr:DUF3788 domain-containing protein [Candidatus Njordarchaeota archaeon]